MPPAGPLPGVTGGQGGVEFAERALEPGHRLLSVDHVGDRGCLDRGHGAQLDAGGAAVRCWCRQQVAQGGSGGLELAEFFFQAAQMGGDPLVAGTQVGR
jgi:hypothetical protein